MHYTIFTVFIVVVISSFMFGKATTMFEASKFSPTQQRAKLLEFVLVTGGCSIFSAVLFICIIIQYYV